ncbi:thiosulfate sulfurtransferase GlpE [Alishewanella sp. HL-SH06]|uniref:thiosulfate sulfurtransferase GlpE n=1 Tax=Alishewanella sp. HL-SH06 TaxID=3461144 RepID=UPI0040417C2B
MSDFKRISVAETQQLIMQQAIIADIRDENSFAAGHIEGAYHLTNGSIVQFMQQFPFEQPIVVVCYHGNSSQGAAQYLAQQGYEEVYSMDGGVAAWRAEYPVVTDDNA